MTVQRRTVEVVPGVYVSPAVARTLCRQRRRWCGVCGQREVVLRGMRTPEATP